MHERFRRVAAISIGAAMLLGFAGVEAGIAQAAVDTPASSLVRVSPQTDPPGPCDSDELGTTKTGSDGNTYTCGPTDSSQSNSDPGDGGSDQSNGDSGDGSLA
jgi:hypothetical protein